ncbi:hypothetical protein HPB50_028702 [Hyalomma asiaticum]|nr:hypothetical protein HPB50_028702 [Hyalomma asiaticum]
MDFSDSLWDDRTPLEQLLMMGLCFGLFLLMISATYLAYFSHTYNLPSRRHVFGMEFDVCTKEVCVEHALRNAVGLEPLRDVLSNLSVRYWPLLDVYGEEYNAPRILLRLLLRLRLDVFVSLRVQRSLRNRSHYVLNIDSPRFGLPEGLLRFDYPDKGVVLDHYHDFIVLVARFFRTDVRLSTVAREIVEFEENLAMVYI